MEEKVYRTIPGIVSESVVVDCDIDIELELRIVAAIKSYQAGVKGMDRLLKQYGDTWRIQLEEAREESSAL